MKKLLTIILAITLLSCFFTSCGTEEDKLLGTWEYKFSSGSSLYASSTYTFSKSGDQYVADLKMGSASGTSFYNSTYEISGNKITFTLENGNTITETYSLSGDTLTIDGMEYTKK